MKHPIHEDKTNRKVDILKSKQLSIMPCKKVAANFRSDSAKHLKYHYVNKVTSKTAGIGHYSMTEEKTDVKW